MAPQDTIDPCHVAEALGLGAPTRPAIVIKDGPAQSWRLSTPSGDYHVKAWQSSDGRTPAGLAAVEEIERSAVALGVRTPEPIVINRRLGNNIVSVHRWVEAASLQPSEPVWEWLGRTVATVHSIRADSDRQSEDELRLYYTGVRTESEWHAWVADAHAQRLPWAGAASTALPDVLAATELITQALESGVPIIPSHRDIIPPNVLSVGSGQFCLIDWDLAGPTVAWFEAVKIALDFGRFTASRGGDRPDLPDREVFQEVLRAYLRSGGTKGQTGRSALSAELGMSLGRMAHAMPVSLGHRGRPQSERDERGEYLLQLLPKFQRRFAQLDQLSEMLAAAVGPD
jgi:hypothetical protein